MGTDDPNSGDSGGRGHQVRAAPKKRPLLQRVFLDNLGLKLISMIIALSLFVFVKEDKGKEADIEVSVVLSNIDDNAVFTGELPRSLRVRVRDRWSRLARVLEHKPNPYLVDLRGFSNDSMYVFDQDHLRQLMGVSGVSIQSVYPAEFAVSLETKIERVVPVRPNLVGEPPQGYVVNRERARVNPGTVRIWGAKSSVRSVDELLTWPIDLATLEKEARVEVAIQKPSQPYLYLDDEKVKVDVPVQELQDRASIGRVDLTVKNCPESLVCTIEPAYVQVTLTGPVPTLLKVKKGALPVKVGVDALDFDPVVSRHEGIRPSCERPADLDCAMTPRSVMLVLSAPTAKDREGKGK